MSFTPSRISASFLVCRGGVMVFRGGRGGWQEGGGGKGGWHETNDRGGGGQGRSRRNQGPRQPGRRPREKSMAWVPPNSDRWAPPPYDSTCHHAGRPELCPERQGGRGSFFGGQLRRRGRVGRIGLLSTRLISGGETVVSQ